MNNPGWSHSGREVDLNGLLRQGAEIRSSCLKALILGATLLVAGVMTADAHHAAFLGVEGPSCALSRWLGHGACPGCGLVRSTVLFVHGRWTEGLAVHPAGILVVFLCIAGLVVHLDILLRGQRGPRHVTLMTWGRRLFVAGLLGVWIHRLVA